MMGKTGGDEWRIYGGHRLWHAPEDEPRTYWPDNKPVNVEDHGDFVRTIQEVEPTTRLQKEMDIFLSPDKAEVKVIHRIYNHHEWAAEFAPWALSVMAAGGVGITPLAAARHASRKFSAGQYADAVDIYCHERPALDMGRKIYFAAPRCK